MPYDEGDALWYPSVDEVLRIHDDIVAEDPDATRGVPDPEQVEFAISHVRDGHFGEVPETIHEKAFHLMRLVASNHWFVDGNKRTALNVTELFYLVNGFELDYGEDLRSMLKLFSVRESLIDREAGAAYLRDQTTRISLDENPALWNALRSLVTEAVDTLNAAVTEELQTGDEQSMRDDLGLTTDFDGTVNNDEEANNR